MEAEDAGHRPLRGSDLTYQPQPVRCGERQRLSRGRQDGIRADQHRQQYGLFRRTP